MNIDTSDGIQLNSLSNQLVDLQKTYDNKLNGLNCMGNGNNNGNNNNGNDVEIFIRVELEQYRNILDIVGNLVSG